MKRIPRTRAVLIRITLVNPRTITINTIGNTNNIPARSIKDNATPFVSPKFLGLTVVPETTADNVCPDVLLDILLRLDFCFSKSINNTKIQIVHFVFNWK